MSIQPIISGGLASYPTTTPPLKETKGDIPAKQADTSTAKAEPTPLATAPADQSGQQSQQEKLSKAIEKLNDFVSGASSDLVFSADKDTDQMVVKVIDNQTKNVIRQFPSEEALQIAKALDKLQGLLVRDKA